MPLKAIYLTSLENNVIRKNSGKSPKRGSSVICCPKLVGKGSVQYNNYNNETQVKRAIGSLKACS